MQYHHYKVEYEPIILMFVLLAENGFYSTLYPNQVFHVNQQYDATGDPNQTGSGVMYLYDDGTTGMFILQQLHVIPSRSTKCWITFSSMTLI